MSQLFQRKADCGSPARDGDTPGRCERMLGAGDLIMLAIGAVIGAGIFSSIGTAAAGEVLPIGRGRPVRRRAGADPVVLLLGAGVRAGGALLRRAGVDDSAGRQRLRLFLRDARRAHRVDHRLGSDPRVRVGNIAVAIAWSGYFTRCSRGFGMQLPDYLTHGYRTALLSSDPAVHGLLQTAPRIAGVPLLLNLPAFADRDADHLAALHRRQARASAPTTSWSSSSCSCWGCSSSLGAMHINPDNYTPFAPNGWRGIHQGAAIVFFAYIGFDAISTAAEETKNPQRNMPIGILGGLAICTVIYVSSASWRPGSCPTSS